MLSRSLSKKLLYVGSFVSVPVRELFRRYGQVPVVETFRENLIPDRSWFQCSGSKASRQIVLPAPVGTARCSTSLPGRVS